MRLTGLALAALLTTTTLTACGSDDPDTSPTSSPSAGASTGAPAGQPLPAGVTARLDKILARAVRSGDLPGVAVGVWGKDGEYVAAAGVADRATGAPMRTDLFHRIGSVTKTFTVTALLVLVDQGRVDLDDPVDRYVDGVPAGDRITLRQLAGMTSGLDDYTFTPDFVPDYLADPAAGMEPASLVARIKGTAPRFAPGSEVAYSNTNTVLLGMVIEKVTGQELAEVIAELVTAPLGLGDTVLPTGTEIPDPHARGTTNQTADGSLQDVTDWNPSWAWAAGAMTSTMEDLRIWAPALAKGTLLSPALQAERLRTRPLAEDADGAGYGLGLFDVNGWIGHNGSLPGYKTVVVYLPEADLTLVAMTNTDAEDEKHNLAGSVVSPITALLTPDHVYR
ncbi:serine hydrolase [Pimelobacter sp. 30-1]|uniref:serine hydrolase domain-containing protein n=1 Tax=Pimelobacter sp. 30-1 TaxID=2004991 RepID=UPI001C04A03E|nr:serine hydrolase domain-containing protein [Pimelobacter sp. 30-1]